MIIALFILILNFQKYKPTSFSREIWNFNDVDIDSALSSVDWNDVFDVVFLDIDLIHQRFFSLFLSTVESFIPHNNVIIRLHDKPWMTGQIRQGICKRDHLLKIYSKRKSPVSWDRYRVQRSLFS